MQDVEHLEIKDREGFSKKVKVILKYKDEISNTCYMIYEYNREYFACKYTDVLGEVQIDTDLTSEEMDMLEHLLKNLEGDKK